MKKYLAPAILDKATTMKDGSIKVQFETQEENPESIANLFSLRNKMGWLIFAPNEVEEVDLPEDPASMGRNAKTPSQRLRSVLFLNWDRMGRKMEFGDYYKREMEKIIELYKEKL